MAKRKTRAVRPADLSTPEDKLTLDERVGPVATREEAAEAGHYCRWCDSALMDPCTEEQSKTCPNRLADEAEERRRR